MNIGIAYLIKREDISYYPILSSVKVIHPSTCLDDAAVNESEIYLTLTAYTFQHLICNPPRGESKMPHEKLADNTPCPEKKVWFMVLNAVFNNISDKSWWSVLLVEETGVPGEN